MRQCHTGNKTGAEKTAPVFLFDSSFFVGGTGDQRGRPRGVEAGAGAQEAVGQEAFIYRFSVRYGTVVVVGL